MTYVHSKRIDLCVCVGGGVGGGGGGYGLLGTGEWGEV